jgi:hypothetical protein
VGRSGRYELLVHHDGVVANLRDVGVGVSQVLPVLAVAYCAPPGSTVLLEEPEIHLHPLAQAVLAEVFAEVSQQRQVQFLVETHSEHLFRRMQTLIARRHRLIQQMDEMSHRYDFDKAKNVLVNTGSYHYKEIFPKEWLGKGKEFPFEDTTVLLPEQADTYLRHFFGDYMKFPPVEQRVEKHLRYYLNMEKRETWDEIKRKL